ncbi:hypothetical protein CDD83_6416 [Cordyceps sp. RAO-2017]|nr:hypothetical protein CDD83_6416 [Cordyceps sp. RAO-2017]
MDVSTALGSIRLAATALCARIASHGQRLSSRGLAVEMRLFAGALYSLETLAAELQPEAARPEPPALLQQFESLVRSVDDSLASLSPSDVSRLRAETRASRDRVTYVLARTQTWPDLALLLSLADEVPAADRDAAEVLAWLRILNSPSNNRRPAHQHEEKRFRDDRRSEQPEYTRAALHWPDEAEKHWQAVAPAVEELFTPAPRSFNFIQWALEYARERFPEQYGRDCRDAGHVADLTHDLDVGAITPLHFAVILGLPSLCRSLLFAGADTHRAGAWGSPLYWALLGEEVLTVRDSPRSWPSILTPYSRLPARHEIIHLLLDADASICRWRFDGPTSRPWSLAGLAFWFACRVNDYGVFERVVNGGAAVDDALASLIAEEGHITEAEPSKTTLELLMTCAFDATYLDETNNRAESPVVDAICRLMLKRGLEFACPPGRSKRLACLSDECFPAHIRDAILASENNCDLKRLMMDPRFDPNLPTDPDTDSGTRLIHIAVAGDGRPEHQDAVALLAKAGADLRARDFEGRTPLLLVESEKMLSQLVALGVPTTDTDSSGRNIWHFAASTNDMPLLNWLLAFDPCKAQNMAVVSDENLTPLELAVKWSETLRHRDHARRRPEPTAALAILEAGARCRPSDGPPVILWGVDWGSQKLVRRLLDAGADARATDDRGRSALHYLNVTASPSLVELVQGLCEGLPISAPAHGSIWGGAMDYDEDEDDSSNPDISDDDLTPAETMLTNTAFTFRASGDTEADHKPIRSC